MTLCRDNWSKFAIAALASAWMGQAMAERSPVDYESPIPGDRPDLADVAIIPVHDARLREVRVRVDGRRTEGVELKYSLPLGLTGGVRKEIRMTSPSLPTTDSFKLASDDGTAECVKQENDNYTCSMIYEKKKLDLEQKAVENYIEQSVLDPTLQSKKLDLARFFINEARGVLHNVPFLRR